LHTVHYNPNPGASACREDRNRYHTVAEEPITVSEKLQQGQWSSKAEQDNYAAMNLDEEVRLYTTSAEREKTENLATLYSIIVSLEYLERAYVRDSVTGKE
jgi:hypothetical protein